MANNVDSRIVCRSMIDDVRKRIHSCNERINRNRINLEKGNKISKFFINREINDDIKMVNLLTELAGKLLVLNMNDDEQEITIPFVLKSDIEDLCALLSEKEVEQFKKIFADFIKKSENDEVKRLNNEINGIDALIEQLNLGNKSFSINENKKETIKYNVASLMLESLPTKKAHMEVNYDKKDKNKSIPFAEDKLVYEILSLKSSGQLEFKDSIILIIENIYSIRNAFVTRTKLNNILQKITIVVSDLDNIENLNVINLKNYLVKLAVKYGRELEKVSSFLDKFDFTDIMKQVQKNMEERQVADFVKYKMNAYEEMSLRLERTKKEDPENKELIEELNKRMAEFAAKSGLSSFQLEEACDNGVMRYNQEAGIISDMKYCGRNLYNEYLDYCKNSKDKEKLTFAEYIRIYHQVPELNEIVDSNETNQLKM